MELKMKNYIFCSLLLLFPLTACSESDSTTTSSQETEYQRQVKTFDKQTKIVAEQQEESERQLKVTAKHLKTAISQQERMEKLLNRWEKQADRYDLILDSWEKKK